MYDSFHDIEIFRDGGEPDTDLVEQSIVGNICESGDILAKKRMLPLIKEGDIVAALDAGAYGFVMSSSYNQRPRAAEVLITSDGTPKLIRRRETLDDLTRCFVDVEHWRGEGTFLKKGSSSPLRFVSHPYFPNRRKRSALSTTETDEKAIAAPAIMGESEGPPKILSTPAAMGRQRML